MTTNHKRKIEIGLNIAIIFAYGSVLILAGHGVAPIALLLILGINQFWIFPVVLGWAGIVLLISSMFSTENKSNTFILPAGLSSLLVSWIIFLSMSERKETSLFYSIPFIILLLCRAIYLILQIRW